MTDVTHYSYIHTGQNSSDTPVRILRIHRSKLSVIGIKNGDFEGNNAYFVYYEIKEAVRKEMIKLIGIYGSANKAWIPEIKQLPRIKEV